MKKKETFTEEEVSTDDVRRTSLRSVNELRANGPAQTLGLKSKNSRNTSPYFYKVTNHHELYKIGNSFYEDFKKGVKSFAISSTGYQTSQQRSILGIASYFDHEEDLKIGVISDNVFLGVFKEIISVGQESLLSLLGGEIEAKVYSFYDHFDFIDLNQFIQHYEQLGDQNFEAILDEIVDEYDLVFWDVPELHKIQENNKVFFPIIMKFDSLSIIVSGKISSTQEVEELRNFFLGYGINLKGLLLDAPGGPASELNKKEKRKKRPWWKIF